MIQIRNVPEELHRTLKTRAAKAGMSLSDYLLRELTYIANTLPMDEWLELVRSRGSTNPDISAADIIREERDSR